VERDTGYRRTGVQMPEQAAELAEIMAVQIGLRFAGLMTYPTTAETGTWIAAAKQAIQRRGLEVRRVSGGGTPTVWRTHEAGEITEIRASVYIYGDRTSIAEGAMSAEEWALRVRATVVSRPTGGPAILDAGSKALTSDSAPDTQGFGLIDEYPDAAIYDLSEEHGYVDVSACSSRPEVGEVVSILPNHACPVSNRYNEVVLHRAGVVIGILPVAARGKVR
jgi:D-serine deaminase-like pyridoxal phosphate-dependent protein